MRIWLITVGEPLPELSGSSRLWRTGILAMRMVKRGHDVLWWTSSVDHFNKRYFVEAPGEYKVGPQLVLRFLHGRLYRRNISWARHRNHVEIAREFARAAPSAARPDLIVCSYPPVELSEAAVRFGREASVPVLLDIRDLWPDEIYARIPRLVRPLSKLFLRALDRSARAALAGAHGLTAISPSYLEWGLRLAGRRRSNVDRVFTHGYPDPLSEPVSTEHSDRIAAIQKQFAGRRIIWFAGTFVGSIDLGTVIEAARLLQGRDDVAFVLTGTGEKEREWRRQAEGLANLTFTGWADRAELDAWARCAWVGLGAYKRGALMSLTNKIFEYLSYGLPVLLSLPGEARGIIESADSGVFYEPGNPSSLASAIRQLVASPSSRDRMARHARQLFSSSYSAEVVYGEMTEYLLSVANQPVQSP